MASLIIFGALLATAVGDSHSLRYGCPTEDIDINGGSGIDIEYFEGITTWQDCGEYSNESTSIIVPDATNIVC